MQCGEAVEPVGEVRDARGLERRVRVDGSCLGADILPGVRVRRRVTGRVDGEGLQDRPTDGRMPLVQVVELKPPVVEQQRVELEASVLLERQDCGGHIGWRVPSRKTVLSADGRADGIEHLSPSRLAAARFASQPEATARAQPKPGPTPSAARARRASRRRQR